MLKAVIIRYKSSGYINQAASVKASLEASLAETDDNQLLFNLDELFEALKEAAGDDADMLSRQTIVNTAFEVASSIYLYKREVTHES